MTERMTNIEFEDVLSSVRRLVSDGQRFDPAPPRSPRLVLTAAQRIHVPDAVKAPVSAAQVGDDTLTLEERIAELEQLLTRRMQEFEPDEGELFMPAAPEFAWPSGSARELPQPSIVQPPPVAEPASHMASPPEKMVDLAATRPQPRPAPQEDATVLPDGDPDASGLFDDGIELIDEEALRDMVRAILREELQGNLGERITRNVRKLVRSEIARALATRAMD